jgi:hypothetical protein
MTRNLKSPSGTKKAKRQHGGARRGAGKHPFQPTKEQRDMVEVMAVCCNRMTTSFDAGLKSRTQAPALGQREALPVQQR